MEYLPTELLCYMLSKLDGQSLTCASRVCRQWYDTVEILGKGFNIWYKCCVKEMELDAMVACTGLLQLYNEPGRAAVECRKDKWKFWRQLYSSYQRSRCICSESIGHFHSGKIIQKHDSTVTALEIIPSTKTSHGSLWLGHSQGVVTVKHLDRDATDCFHLQRTFSFVRQCTGMAKVSTGGCPGYATGENPVQTYVICTSHDGHVYISNREKTWLFQSGSSKVNCVASLGPYFAIGHVNSVLKGISIYKICPAFRSKNFSGSGRLQQKPYSVTSIIKLSGTHTSQIVSLDFSHDRLFAASEQGSLYMWKFPCLSNFEGVDTRTSSHTSLDTAIIHVDKPTTTAFKVDRGIQQVLIYGGNPLVLAYDVLGENEVFLIDKDFQTPWLIDNKNLIKLTGNVNVGRITCMAASGPLLALGSISGHILLFKIENKPDWNVDIQKKYLKTFYSKVQNLSVLKFYDNAKGKVLVAGGQQLYEFTWTGQNPGDAQMVDEVPSGPDIKEKDLKISTSLAMHICHSKESVD